MTDVEATAEGLPVGTCPVGSLFKGDVSGPPRWLPQLHLFLPQCPNSARADGENFLPGPFLGSGIQRWM